MYQKSQLNCSEEAEDFEILIIEIEKKLEMW